MNNDRDPVLDRIESAQRMLGQARTEYGKGNAEDAMTFLDVAGTRIKAANDAIQSAGKNKPVSFADRKEVAHAR